MRGGYGHVAPLVVDRLERTFADLRLTALTEQDGTLELTWEAPSGPETVTLPSPWSTAAPSK